MTNALRALLMLLPALVALAPQQSQAGVHLVKDLATGDDSAGAELLGTSGGLVFFVTGSTSGYSRVMWSSDGTSTGTQKVAVVALPLSFDPRSLFFADIDGTAFFVNSASGHPEIWKSDGTAAGTVRVASSTALAMRDLTNVGGELYFASSPDLSSYDLWKSDGTEAGTEIIADIDYGSAMRDVAGIAWFKGTDAGGWEPWRSDGTAAGTYRVADISPGAAPSHASGFHSIGGLVCFIATEPGTGAEIWASDGTGPGTHLVMDLNGTSNSSIQGSAMESGGKLYFSAYGPEGLRLYASDCTEAGTVALESLASPATPVAAGGLLYFEATAAGTGEELWKTDGTPGAATLVRDIRPGPVSSGPGDPVSLGGFAYFSANDGTTGWELWRTDGTSVGTARVADILPGPAGSNPGPILVAGGMLVFAATSSSGELELWNSNGTEAGTSMVVDLDSGPSESSEPHGLTATGERVAFEISRGDVAGRWWVSDGTGAGTLAIPEVDAALVADWDGRLVLSGDPFLDPGIWIRDPDGTLTKISDESGFQFTAVGAALFFTRSGTALVTDGAPGSEVELASFGSGNSPFGFVDIGTTVLIPLQGNELWRTNGTIAGTSKVADVVFNSTSSVDGAVLGGKLLFSAFDAGSGFELWSSDGSEAGTTLLADIESGAAGSGPSDLVVVGERVFFVATTTAGGRELWSTDGTVMGTMQAGDIQPGPAHSYPQDLTALGDVVVFSAQEAGAGHEVWRSDGTVMGTIRVADIRPGTVGSTPSDLEAAGARVYFRADNGINGAELWSTDGTEAGTQLIADINPGGTWSWPVELTTSGSHLFFAATTMNNGTELWALDLPVNCGNGTIDEGEICDDGNLDRGDGCDDECVLESCGDGVLDTGEQCDDGNRTQGDGCSRACTIDCPSIPQNDCRPPLESGASRLMMRANDNPSRSQLKWSWREGDSPKEDFGQPTISTGFAVCVYDGSGLLFDANAAGGSTCDTRPCWTEQSAGYSFKRKSATGSFQMKLQGSPYPGGAQLGLKMRGNEVGLPDLMQLSAPLHVRLRNELGCWGADYSPPLGKHTEKMLKAESD